MRLQRSGPSLLWLAALGLTGGVFAAAALSTPRITELSPPGDGSPAPALASISITFSQPMQTDSVESRFRLTPPRPGAFRWDGRRMTFTPTQPWSEGETVRVELAAGARSQRGLPMPAGTAWSFVIGSGRLAYLWPAGEAADIYLWSPTNPEAERLTRTSGGVIDFSLAPQGGRLILARRSGDSTEIVQVHLADGAEDLLHRCRPGVSCRSPALSPDGRILTYVQDEPAPDGTTLRRVMALELGGSTAYAVAGDDHAASQPAWSARGWLALYDHTFGAYAVYDEVTPQAARLVSLLPNALGEAPVWSPDGAHLVVAEIVFLPESGVETERPPRFYSHLVRVAVDDGTQLDLSGDETILVEDSGPAYAPDGSWIAFSRRSLDPAAWSLGRQIWRMRPDGVDAEPLTEALEFNHAGLAWSPDGSRLAYQVFDQLNPTDPSAIWWLDVREGEGGRIVVGGYSPRWIP